MRFTLSFLGSLGILLLGVAATNYIVNPYAIYPTRWFIPASANDLDRSLRELEDPALKPELVVFGSSRSWVLLPRDLECYSGLRSTNRAYASATPEGYYALASYLLETKPAPRMLIVGVDVEAFQTAVKFGDPLHGVPRLQRYLKGPDRIVGLWLDATNLLSLAQLSDSVRVLLHEVELRSGQVVPSDRNEDELVNVPTPQPLPVATGQTAGVPAKAPAPSTVPPPIQNQDETSAKKTIAHYYKRYRDYTALSTEQQTYFESLLKLAYDHQIHVKLFISTMHPRLIAALNKQGYYPKRYADLRAWLDALGKKYPFDFYDFSTPDTYHGNNTDFFNLAHIDATNSARLIGALFQETGRAAQCAPE